MATPEKNEHARGMNGAVAAELRAERAARGMSNQDIADRSGISKVSVQRYLAPTRAIDVAILEALSASLGVSMSDIVLRAGERRRRESHHDGLDEQQQADRRAGKSAITRALRDTAVVKPKQTETRQVKKPQTG